MTSLLELRLERVNRVGDLRLKKLKRLYDGRPIGWGERYLDGRLSLHIHVIYLPTQAALCWEYLAGETNELLSFAVRQGHSDISRSYRICQLPVFVWIGQHSEGLRPLASIARLQFLDGCDVGITDTLEICRPPSVESASIRIDRKLRSILLLAGIEKGEFIDQVVEGGAKVVDDFADEDSDVGAEGSGLSPMRPSPLGHRIEIVGQVVLVRIMVPPLSPFEVLEVVTCPLDPEISPVESMHEVESGYGEDTEDAKGLHDTSPDSPTGRGRAGQDGQADEAVSHSSPPEEVASQTSPDRRSGGCSATRTRLGSPEDA